MASLKALLIITAAMAVVVVGALLPATVSAGVVYKVGDTNGWDLEVDYDKWASQYTFHAGDVLEFAYSPEDNPTVNVKQVDASNFDACTAPSGSLTMESGDDKVRFSAPGQYHFICGNQDYCKWGMKLAVNVVQ